MEATEAELGEQVEEDWDHEYRNALEWIWNVNGLDQLLVTVEASFGHDKHIVPSSQLSGLHRAPHSAGTNNQVHYEHETKEDMSDTIGSANKSEGKMIDPADPQMSVVSAAVQTAQIIYNGGVPDNEQIIATIDGTLHAMEERAREAVLNQRGQLLANDAQRILEQSKKFVEEKNHDELFQKIFQDTKAASSETREQATKFRQAANIDAVQGQANDIMYIIKSILFEIVKSKDFRRLITDSVKLLQNIFWRQLDSTGTIINEEVKAGSTSSKTGKLPDYTARDYKIPEGQRMVYIPDKVVPNNNNDASEREKAEFLDKVSTILEKLSSNQEYSKAMQNIFALFDRLSFQSTVLNDKSTTESMSLTENQLKVRDDIIMLIERWTGEGSLKPVIVNIKNFYKIVAKDQRAVSFLREGRIAITNAFKNPDTLNHPEDRQRFSLLIDQYRSLLSDPRYSYYWKDILDQISDVMKSFKDDEVSQDLADAIRNFVQDMTLDSNGRVSLGSLQDSIIQMKSLFLPVILKQLEAIPIGRIEGSNPKMDYVVDHVILSAYDVLPEMIKFNFLTVINVDMRELATDNAKARMRLEIKNIRSHLRDIYFKFNRKVFPKIDDEGRADIDVHGDGLSMSIEWEISSEAKSTGEPVQFVLKQCQVTCDQVSVTVKAAKHPTMDRIGIKLLSGKVKRQVEAKTREYLEYFGGQFADGLNRAIKHKRTDPRKSLAEAEREGLVSRSSYQGSTPTTTSQNVAVPPTATRII
ncbi:hypothetical protein PROFUN_03308 [Planoprotostelium fungivorum]|uniref:HAM1-like N-terminal domain-containing protein n=1 Tax=Planoprotostelium fungivorum TaxID=1890364 RepID=A0A2P6NWQ3_9EUKA|nr:hypothetical protein PROFUN_03308 [Planoprotostelium fungivorum]